jgi:hypothetical protein
MKFYTVVGIGDPGGSRMIALLGTLSAGITDAGYRS